MAFLYNEIFKIPEPCLVERKLTKAFFLKNFELTATEKKLLNSDVQSMEWLASIKPALANIPALIDSSYSFEEIQVFVCTVLDNKLNELADSCLMLMQKYIPYQMLVIVEDQSHFVINVTDKRINLSDTTKRTINRYNTTTAIPKLYKNSLETDFFEALHYSKLDKTNLQTTYNSYIQAVINYKTASITGSFINRSHSRTVFNQELLAKIEAINKEIVKLSNQIKKEKQLNNKVALNIEVQNLKSKIELLKRNLSEQ